MSLKLIKEANVLSTLDSKELAALTAIKHTTGKKSIAEIVESFKPSSQDYEQWMSVIVGYAKDEGININTKSAFAEVAGAVLENDPASPPADMQSAIINKLWTDRKSAKHQSKIDKIAQAQEEEEQLDQLLRSRSDDEGDGPDTVDQESESGDEFGEYSSTDKFGVDDSDDSDIDDGEVSCPECGCKFHPDASSPDEDVSDEDFGDEDPSAEEIGKSIVGSMRKHTQENEEQSRGPMTARTGEEVKQKAAPSGNSIMHQVFTAPRKAVNAELKKIKEDGRAAAKAHSLPKNPHPEGSQAHSTWQRGSLEGWKARLGLDTPAPRVKPKRK